MASSSSQERRKPPIPSYICHHPRNIPSSTLRNASSSSSSSQFKFINNNSNRPGSASRLSKSNKSLLSSSSNSRVMVGGGGPLMDEVAIRTVISILSGYIGRYLNDGVLRSKIREKCNSFLDKGRTSDDEFLFENMKLGMERIDRLVEEEEEYHHKNKKKKEVLVIKSLKDSIEILAVVASLNAKNASKSHLCACAQLYLAIAYKLIKNERVSSRHLLQVFCDSPFLARTYLLPDLWEHLFLPHLLHLKVWYNKELECISNDEDLGDDEKKNEKKKKMKVLGKVYNDKMDSGTVLFAMYYKQWLKVGASEPPLPVVSLPSMPRSNRSPSRTRKSSDSYVSNSSINPNLYKAVFGSKLEPTRLDDQNGVLTISKDLEKDEKVQKEENTYLGRSSFQIDHNHAQSWREPPQRLDYLQCFSCRNITTEESYGNCKNASIRKEITSLPSEFIGAVKTLCSSDILTECESSIRVVTRAWLRSPGDPLIEEALAQSSVIEAILEVLFASTEDEILELIISILAELVSRNDSIRQIIINSDPQLETFVRLLRSTSLFLKAAVLLYLSKPQAKQMLSSEWVPLVLRVLEFGDKLQTLFTVQCSPQVAAFYFLDQLLTGFDEDKNLENARQVLSLGGLTLLMRRIEGGEFHERNKAALIISCCIRAEGSCRSFLAENVNKSSLLELIVLGNKQSSKESAFSVLAELLCLDRRVKVFNFLRGLKDGWGGLNIMHILYIYLQKAPAEECPLVAVIIFLLDLMEDPSKGSLYRTEAIEALIASLNCQTCDDRVQHQSARALHLLGGHFSCTGEPLLEKSLLQQAGFREICLEDSSNCNEMVVYDRFNKNKEKEEIECWQQRAARVLFKTGNTNLVSSLADSIANGTPSLARASLITISWMSSYFHFVEDRELPQMAFSILMPQLIQSLNYDKDVEERVLASYSLLCLVRNSGCVSVLQSAMDKDSLRHLRNLSLVTWTANELTSILQSRQ